MEHDFGEVALNVSSDTSWERRGLTKALGGNQAMPWIGDGKFWVGRHETRGVIVIPKSSMSPDSMSFEVYFVDHDRIASCDADVMRKFTRAGGVTSDEAKNALQAFHTLRDRELEEKNRRFLERRGKSFTGTRPRSSALPSRATHCFACKDHLDSTINLECVACEWLLCQCGACGCAYDRAYAP